MSDLPFIPDDEPGTMSDQDVCIAMGEDLTAVYPGYLWRVGCNHEAGVAAVNLVIPGVTDNPLFTGANRPHGFLVHLSSVMGASGQRKVRAAGGELLERWGLPRGKAPEDVIGRASAHGMDRGGEVLKSRH